MIKDLSIYILHTFLYKSAVFITVKDEKKTAVHSILWECVLLTYCRYHCGIILGFVCLCCLALSCLDHPVNMTTAALRITEAICSLS